MDQPYTENDSAFTADGTKEPMIILAQVSCPTEFNIIKKWVSVKQLDSPDQPIEVIQIAFPKQLQTLTSPELIQRLQQGDNPSLVPVRVGWLPKERQGKRKVCIRDLLIIGDPRRPRNYAKPLIAKKSPERYKVLQGEAATEAELRTVWEQQSSIEEQQASGFARFVVRRATLALERSSSQLLGPQYKMPKLVFEEIRTSARFTNGIIEIADKEQIPLSKARDLADTALKELASGYTPLGADVNKYLGRFLYTKGYDEQLDYDMSQVEKVREALKGKSGIVLPSHRSNLDVGVMTNAFHELGLPKTNTLGGINMSFWPMGYIMRRSGVIFIRRDVRSDPMYRWVLKEYLGYLVEKRFSLQWYIEGTRSRTGKSLPPKLGLMKYVVDAYTEGRTDDIPLIPASMTYDQLNEVKEYAGEAMGKTKQAENLGWMLRYYKSMTGRFGQIHVRFGEPVSVAQALGTPEEASALSPAEYRLALQKLAFEVSWRINKVTPITAVSLITMTVLSAYERAMTFNQLSQALGDFLSFTETFDIPTTKSAKRLIHTNSINAELKSLIRMGVIHAEEEGPDAVYAIGHNQHVAASFYRNSIVHHFLNAAICEVSLASACHNTDKPSIDKFWEMAYRLRDTLKFDFFFQEKQQFAEAISQHMSTVNPDWLSRFDQDCEDIFSLIKCMRPLTAISTLRSFLESYWIVAHCLQLKPELHSQNPTDFLKFCSGTARQYLLQRLINHPEVISIHLFKTGLELAQNRGVFDLHGEEKIATSKLLANEIHELLEVIDRVYTIGQEAFTNRIFTETSDNA